jgi:hypothetical protein
MLILLTTLAVVAVQQPVAPYVNLGTAQAVVDLLDRRLPGANAHFALSIDVTGCVRYLQSALVFREEELTLSKSALCVMPLLNLKRCDACNGMVHSPFSPQLHFTIEGRRSGTPVFLHHGWAF